MAIRLYTIKPRVWAGLGGQDGGQIIAPRPLANMKKMSDLEVNSFSSSDEATTIHIIIWDFLE